VRPVEWFSGGNDGATEVAVADSDDRPTMSAVRDLWKERHGKRPVTLLLVVRYPSPHGECMSICGPVGEDPPVLQDLEPSQVERLCAAALSEPDRHSAARFLAAHLPEMESELPGVRNSGMLAMHELLNGVPLRADWDSACNEGRSLLAVRGRALVEALDFSVELLPGTASVLTVNDHKRAVAVFLEEGETFEDSSPRFNGVSPVSKALAVADAESLPWVVLTRGRQIRLYAARSDTGVGRKGRAETFIELDLSLLAESNAGYLPLLFGAAALATDGTFEQVLDECAKFAAQLGARLRERVYFEAVPPLATAIANRAETEAVDFDAPFGEGDLLGIAYEMTMLVLFRLLFVAYAEDKDLLPYRTNSHYREHSLKSIAQRLAEFRRTGHDEFDPVATSLWVDVGQLWRAVDAGNNEWGVPAYSGGLFEEDDPDSHLAGHLLGRIELTNAEFAPALTAMLVDTDIDGTIGPVDFRSLSVREFGTIYEGLLESELSRAPSDLTVKKAKGNDTYVPAKKNDTVEVADGQIYFHNSSGVRKSTGSYFTKSFAVEHLLDHALEPALDDHLARIAALLAEGDDLGAAETFFDFRCVDLAMGSGHFLVAAVDRIEARLSAFLAEHPIAEVHRELESLRNAAHTALGELAIGVEIETGTLLRRQIARRCIYGVDLNKIAVELSRLAIWVHTFVPGLPLSFLDRTLVQGSSLTGIGTVDEAVEILEGKDATGTMSLFRGQIMEFLDRASDHLRRLATIAELSIDDIERSHRAHAAAVAAVEPAAQLFDILIAARIGETTLPVNIDESRLAELHVASGAAALSEQLAELHFPIIFPEVFLSETPGFDCILGNPPWEEVIVEELQFWSSRFPELKRLDGAKQRERLLELRSEHMDLAKVLESERATVEALRRSLTSGIYPGMGVGDPDLYKAFLWRFTELTASRGTNGVVLPRSVFAALGSAPWRLDVFARRDLEITLCKNKGEWLFTDVNPGYPICLVVILPPSETPQLRVRGTYMSEAEYLEGISKAPAVIEVPVLRGMDDNLCVPAVDTADEMSLLSKLVQHMAFGNRSRPDWCAVPATELHASNDKAEFFTDDSRDHPIYNHLNVGHFTFDASPGAFNWADLQAGKRILQDKRASNARRSRSPFRRMPEGWERDPESLPCSNPRVTYRAIAHSSNPRKIWFAVAPVDTLLTNAAPYLVFWQGGVADEAYVLGLMNSSVVDWFGHLRVALNINIFIVNSIPIPIRGYTSREDRLVSLAAGLALAAEGDLGEWSTLGEPITDDDARAGALAEIDAISTLLFGLDDDDLPLIFNIDTRPSLGDVLAYRKRWE
jgi:hypothetical protein